MKTLKEMIDNPDARRTVLADSRKVLDDEVSKRSGLSGMAIKGAFKLLKSAQQGRALDKVLDILLPDFVDAFEPYFQRYQKEGQGKPWLDFIRPHFDAIADALLAVTDGKVAQTDSKAARNAYGKLRPKAKKEVVASLPALGRMMERYF